MHVARDLVVDTMYIPKTLLCCHAKFALRSPPEHVRGVMDSSYKENVYSLCYARILVTNVLSTSLDTSWYLIRR